MIEWLNSNQGVIDLAMTALFILASVIVLRANFRANEVAEATLAQMREERRQERRPFVYFDVEITNRYQYVSFKLENKGKGAAKNIRVMLDGDLELSKDRRLSQMAVVRPLGFLAPNGGRFVDFADMAHVFFNRNAEATLSGRVDYEGTDGHRYTSPIDINFQLHSHRGIVFRRGMTELVRVVDDLVREMERKL